MLLLHAFTLYPALDSRQFNLQKGPWNRSSLGMVGLIFYSMISTTDESRRNDESGS